MAAANSIGEAVITIGADASQFASQLSKSTKAATSGMSRQISKDLGRSLGEVGKKLENVGGRLTNSITKPALIAGGAIATLVGALGFKRLIGLDNAKAKLKGLGYQAEDVERIADQVTKAIDGGMTTMAEGVDVAAGALASGVKEGKDLAKYIKLVGDAAIGSNREVAEMAQIFNRVQGSGKLMTRELNQIEMGMPGFANAMAKSLGVPQEELRKMVTAGEVSSEEFLDVMEGFAGGMASAYADTFSGMAKNVLAYVGIIGESLLGGVFEQSKDSLRSFIDILKSDEVQARAREIGEQLGGMFTKMIDGVKNAVDWWNKLSPAMKKLIGVVAVVAVAAGPLLMVFGKLVSFAGSLVTGFTLLRGPISAVLGSFGGLTGAGGALSGTLGSLLGPIALVVGSLVLMWTNSEKFRDAVGKLLGVLGKMGEALGKVLGPILEIAIGLISKMAEILGDVLGKALELVTPMLETLAEAIGKVGDWIGDKLAKAVEWLDEVFEEGSTSGGVFGDILRGIAGSGEWLDKVFEEGSTSGGAFGDMLRGTKTVLEKVDKGVETTANWIVNDFIPAMEEGAGKVQEWFDEFIRPGAMVVLKRTGEAFERIWTNIKIVGNDVYEWFRDEFIQGWQLGYHQLNDSAGSVYTHFRESMGQIKELGNTVWEWWTGEMVPGWVTGYHQLNDSAGGFYAALGESWEQIKTLTASGIEWVLNKMGTDTETVKSEWNASWAAIGSFLSDTFTNIKNIVTIAINVVKNSIGTTINGIKNNWRNVWNNIKSFFSNITNNIVSAALGFASSVRNTFNNVMNFIRGIPGRVIGFFSGIGGSLVGSGRALIDGFLSGIRAGFESVKGFVSDSIANIRSFFPFSPAKQGAFSGRGWVTYAGKSLGKSFMESTADAIGRGQGLVDNALGRVSDSFNVGAGGMSLGLGGVGNVSTDGTLAVRGSRSAYGDARNSTSSATTFSPGAIVVQGTLDPARTAQEVANRIAAEAML